MKSIATRIASKGRGLYYTAKIWKDEFRIRIYTVRGGQVFGLDQLLTQDEQEKIGFTRTPFAQSSMNGPGGIVLSKQDRRTPYAIVVRVGRLLGLKGEPISL